MSEDSRYDTGRRQHRRLETFLDVSYAVLLVQFMYLPHGRYDVVTPAKIAYDLARAWPQAELRIVADAGHAMTEPGIVHELIAATKRFAATCEG